MPAVLSTIPEAFNFVLRRYDRDPKLAFRFTTYGENTVSRNIQVGDKAAATLFLHTKPARDRATKLGWIDETSQFLSHKGETISTPDEKQVRRRRGRPAKRKATQRK